MIGQPVLGEEHHSRTVGIGDRGPLNHHVPDPPALGKDVVEVVDRTGHHEPVHCGNCCPRSTGCRLSETTQAPKEDRPPGGSSQFQELTSLHGPPHLSIVTSMTSELNRTSHQSSS